MSLFRENDILKEQLKMMVQRRDSLKFTDSTPTPGDSTIGEISCISPHLM